MIYTVDNPVYRISRSQSEQQSLCDWRDLLADNSQPISSFCTGDVLMSGNSYDSGYNYQLTAEYGDVKDPKFNPRFTPGEMLKLGVFEGRYLNDDIQEFPIEWFQDARVSINAPDISKNAMNIKCRSSLAQWTGNQWIHTDKKGWFQWYCRYYMGRRLGSEDDHQKARWRSFNRHYGQVRGNCAPLDISCRIKQRQALLQWSYEYLF